MSWIARVRLAWAVLRGAEVVADVNEGECAKLQRQVTARTWGVMATMTVWVPATHTHDGVRWAGIVPVLAMDQRVTVVRW